MRFEHTWVAVVCVNEQKPTAKCSKWNFLQRFILSQRPLTWMMFHTLSVNKSNYLLGSAEQCSPSPKQRLTCSCSTSSHLWHVSPESIRKLQGGICILTMLTAEVYTSDSSDTHVRTSACLLLAHVWPTILGELAVVYALLNWSHMRERFLSVYFEID